MVNIKLCADLCKESYSDHIPPGFIDVDDMRYGVRQVGDIIYIVFRGTDNPKNWGRDILAFPPRRSPDGYLAHRGFVGAFRKLVKTFAMPKGKVIFTGHSFGGALALLFAERFQAPCVTFGCPRVYWRFGGGPKIEHVRFVDGGDPVPMVPRYFFSHKHPETLLPDDDHLIEVGDHFMDVYIERLNQREEKLWLAFSQP